MHFAPIATNKRLDAQASKGDVCMGRWAEVGGGGSVQNVNHYPLWSTNGILKKYEEFLCTVPQYFGFLYAEEMVSKTLDNK